MLLANFLKRHIIHYIVAMKNFLQKIFSWVRNQTWIPEWLRESNREKHLVLGIPCGFLSLIFTLGCASGLETKDVQYNNWDFKAWDWKDFGATMIGGFLGFLIRSIIILVILLIVL